jgi:hypothetical protein
MATYRFSVSLAKRSEGRSATAMAAYRAGKIIKDRRTGVAFDYSRKQGVLFSQVMVPDDAPDWAGDRAELWNRSEAAEKRAAAHVAREIQLSLPHELTNKQRQEITAQFARLLCYRYNVAVDVCIHAPGRDNDQRNHHAHLMLCQRPFDATEETGLSRNKIRGFDAIASQRKQKNNPVEEWRSTWQKMVNDALKIADVKSENGAPERVNCLSYERQREAEAQSSQRKNSAAFGFKSPKFNGE